MSLQVVNFYGQNYFRAKYIPLILMYPLMVIHLLLAPCGIIPAFEAKISLTQSSNLWSVK